MTNCVCGFSWDKDSDVKWVLSNCAGACRGLRPEALDPLKLELHTVRSLLTWMDLGPLQKWCLLLTSKIFLGS